MILIIMIIIMIIIISIIIMIIIKKQYNIITDVLGVCESSSYNELDGDKGTTDLEAVQHDIRMTFIPEQAHFISLYFFASVLMMPRRRFVPDQVIPKRVHPGFHSE